METWTFDEKLKELVYEKEEYSIEEVTDYMKLMADEGEINALTKVMKSPKRRGFKLKLKKKMRKEEVLTLLSILLAMTHDANLITDEGRIKWMITEIKKHL